MTAAHKRANAARHEIARHFVHQVALPDVMCCMENFTAIRQFITDMNADHRSTWITAIFECGTEERYRLHCFESRKHAERFAAHFEGVLFEPAKDRGKGSMRDAWQRQGSWRQITACGPLQIPQFFRDHP